MGDFLDRPKTGWQPEFRSVDCLRQGLVDLRNGKIPTTIAFRVHGFVDWVPLDEFGEEFLIDEEAVRLAKEFLQETCSRHPALLLDLCSLDYRYAYPTGLLESVLEDVPQDRVKTLRCQDFRPTPALLEMLSQKLQSVQGIEIGSAFFRDETEPLSLLNCLATLRGLKALKFSFKNIITPEDFEDLGGLEEDEIVISHAVFEKLFHCLGRLSTRLEELTLLGLPYLVNLQNFFGSLNGQSKLKTLRLASTYWRVYLSPSNTEYLTQMLQRNASVQSLSLSSVPVLSIVQALATNTTLRELSFFFYGSERKIAIQAPSQFLPLLKDQQNYTLQSLTISYNDYPSPRQPCNDAKVDFYLRLNKEFHRKFLLSGTATMEDWIDIAILSAKDEPAVVFYYLSQNLPLVLLPLATQNL
jgi:hypothetical protein